MLFSIDIYSGIKVKCPPPLILHLPTSNSLSREGGVHCPPLSLQRWHDVPPLQWKGKVPFRIFLLLNEEGSTLLYTFFPLYLGKVLPPPLLLHLALSLIHI